MIRICLYCWCEYRETKLWRSQFCSPECRSRNTAWDRCIRDSRRAAVSGDVNKPAPKVPALPSAGRTLTKAVGRFQLTLDIPETPATTRARFYVRRVREDRSVSFVGPLPVDRAVPELAAWLDAGYDADLLDEQAARAELKLWERTVRTGARYYPEGKAA
jgi:hypothetical protein